MGTVESFASAGDLVGYSPRSGLEVSDRIALVGSASGELAGALGSNA